jgi:hypothetical protein
LARYKLFKEIIVDRKMSKNRSEIASALTKIINLTGSDVHAIIVDIESRTLTVFSNLV